MKNYTNPQPTLMDKVQAIALARSYANGTFHSVAYRSERILSEKYAFATIVKISVNRADSASTGIMSTK